MLVVGKLQMRQDNAVLSLDANRVAATPATGQRTCCPHPPSMQNHRSNLRSSTNGACRSACITGARNPSFVTAQAPRRASSGQNGQNSDPSSIKTIGISRLDRFAIRQLDPVLSKKFELQIIERKNAAASEPQRQARARKLMYRKGVSGLV
jgi:hypothetical protein